MLFLLLHVGIVAGRSGGGLGFAITLKESALSGFTASERSGGFRGSSGKEFTMVAFVQL